MHTGVAFGLLSSMVASLGRDSICRIIGYLNEEYPLHLLPKDLCRGSVRAVKCICFPDE